MKGKLPSFKPKKNNFLTIIRFVLMS